MEGVEGTEKEGTRLQLGATAEVWLVARQVCFTRAEVDAGCFGAGGDGSSLERP